MALTPAQAFKIGFLLRCAHEGLAPAEMQQRVKTAMSMEKTSLLGLNNAAAGFARGIGSSVGSIPGRIASLAGPLLSLGGLAAVGVPALGGALAGYGVAKATATDHDELEQAKQDEIEGEYYRLAQEAKRNAQRKRLQSRLGQKVTLVSPGLT